MEVVSVGIGGAMGAILRWMIVKAFSVTGGGFPIAILLVNATGALLMGMAMFQLHNVPQLQPWRPLIITGGLGALTTYSAFAWDSYVLWLNGQVGLAALNVILNTVICLSMVALGYNFKYFF